MPAWVKDENKWGKAKKIVGKNKKYGEMKEENPDRYYSVVTSVYKDIKGRIKEAKKKR